MDWKLRLFKEAVRRGGEQKQIRRLLRLIEWLLELPPELEQASRQEFFDWQREQGMPYIGGWEKIILEEGETKGSRQRDDAWLNFLLKKKFGPPGEAYLQEPQARQDRNWVDLVMQESIAVQTVEELIAKIDPPN